ASKSVKPLKSIHHSALGVLLKSEQVEGVNEGADAKDMLAASDVVVLSGRGKESLSAATSLNDLDTGIEAAHEEEVEWDASLNGKELVLIGDPSMSYHQAFLAIDNPSDEYSQSHAIESPISDEGKEATNSLLD
ncbi:hypothetical protein KI387_005433, partial [Taxus chinensis]